MYNATINVCCTAQTCLKPLTVVTFLPLKLQSRYGWSGRAGRPENKQRFEGQSNVSCKQMTNRITRSQMSARLEQHRNICYEWLKLKMWWWQKKAELRKSFCVCACVCTKEWVHLPLNCGVYTTLHMGSLPTMQYSAQVWPTHGHDKDVQLTHFASSMFSLRR